MASIGIDKLPVPSLSQNWSTFDLKSELVSIFSNKVLFED